MRHKFLITIIFYLSIFTTSAEEIKHDYVLCINSYNDASAWSDRIISTVSNTIQSEYGVALAVEHMTSLSIESLDSYNLYKKDLIDKYDGKKPKALLLLGNPSFSMKDDFRERWGDIPIILYGILDYTSRIPYHSRSVMPLEIRIPITELQDKYNVTLLHANLFIAENIANIVSRFPKVENIILLRDNRQINSEIEACARLVLSQNYPTINLEVYSPEVIDVNDLIDKLNKIDTEKNAVLFSSWNYSSQLGNFNRIIGNTGELIATADVPIFTLNFADIINEKGSMHSGVTFNSEMFRVQLSQTLKAVLSGVQPRDINFYTPKESYTYVDYKIAENKGTNLANITKNTIVLNPPKTFIEKYGLIVVVVFIFIIITILFVYSNSRRRAAEVESELNKRLKAEADESNCLKSAFLANMSHEIRTPLNAIVGFSELLSDTNDEKEKSEYVDIIKQNNEHLLKLIGDILDLSKLEAGMVEINPKPLDLSRVLNDSYSYWSRRFASKNIKFELKTCSNSCNVCLDEKTVLQVTNNFLSNAYKFTAKGEVTLSLEAEKQGVKISVKDTGIGIKEEKKDLVFGRFAKLNEFAQGTGLGLSISKVLVDICGGEIGFTSNEGAGTTFWAYFPTEVTLKERKDSVRDNSKSLVETATATTKKKILIAEDNDSNYKLVEAILKKDFDLVRAFNGEIAVNLFMQNAFDIILMDMRMPIMDGLTAVKKIREINTDVPIVAVTANAFETDVIEALKAGCNGFQSKPLNRTKLINEIVHLTS